MRYRRTNMEAEIESNAMFGIEKMEVRQPSLVDEFYHSTTVCPETGVEVTGYHHPLYMLFNQQRLDRLGEGAIRQWLDSLDRAGNNAVSEIRSKISDDDLLKLVKPRNIQSPSELESWINYLNERQDVFNKEVAQIVAEQKEQQEQQLEQQISNEQVKTE